MVTISNVTVNISPKAVIAELQPVTLEEVPGLPSSKDTVEPTSFNISEDTLTNEEFAKANEIISKNGDTFARGDTDIGHVTTVKHRSELVDPTPFKQRCRHIPPSIFQEVRNHLQQLVKAGMIQRSKSPFSSNVVLVREKNKDLRMCVDYGQLNNKTKKFCPALRRLWTIIRESLLYCTRRQIQIPPNFD
jgi:hypothetical protein